MLIGPFALGLVGSEREGVMHVAELGVVMMLFLIGLELRPALLWQLRGSIFGMGGYRSQARPPPSQRSQSGLGWTENGPRDWRNPRDVFHGDRPPVAE
jgi:hypothetical protein